MKIVIQKNINLISGFVNDDEEINSDIFFSKPFSPEKDEENANIIVNSQGNSYLADDIEHAKKLYFKAEQLFFVYNEKANTLSQLKLPDNFIVEKNKKTEQDKIDLQTQENINEGFEFDGHLFSLSQHAQLNWQNLLLFHQSGIFGKSQKISTKNGEVYTLSEDKLLLFIKAKKEKIAKCLDVGRKKKRNLKVT